MTELRHGSPAADRDDLQPIQVVINEADDARTAQVKALVEELAALGCAEPALDSEIADPATGHQLAVAEAFWADGLQLGQGRPVVLELDPASSDVSRLTELGYEVFTSVDALRGFVLRRNKSAAGEAIAAVGTSAEVSRPATESDFDRAMRSLYERARQEANYPAARFLSMLAEYGGLGTARRLLQTPAVSDGFATLWERGRLDLTVEALALQPCYAELFTDAERETARARLDQFGYRSPPSERDL